VALQDFVGRRWPETASDHPPHDVVASDDARAREMSLWRVDHEACATRRPPPPSDRMRQCHMPRRVFLAVACGWGLMVAALLTAVLALRWLG
jgi:hypothetical protein